MFPRTTHAFTLHNSVIKGTVRSSSSSVNPLHAAPKRLEENVEGVVYVNDKVCVEFVLYSTAWRNLVDIHSEYTVVFLPNDSHSTFLIQK